MENREDLEMIEIAVSPDIILLSDEELEEIGTKVVNLLKMQKRAFLTEIGNLEEIN